MTVIEGGAGGQPSVELLPPVAEPSALTPRNYEAALTLIEHAARALDILSLRRDELEASLDSVSKQAEGALSAAKAKVLDWQKLAATLKNEVRELDRRLDAMQQRAELAEAQIQGERDRAAAAERKAADAVLLSEGFHSKILAAFGQGSSAQRVLRVAGAEPGRAGAEDRCRR